MISRNSYLTAPPAGFEPAHTAPETVCRPAFVIWSDLRKRLVLRVIGPCSIATLSRQLDRSGEARRFCRSAHDRCGHCLGPCCGSCPTESRCGALGELPAISD